MSAAHQANRIATLVDPDRIELRQMSNGQVIARQQVRDLGGSLALSPDGQCAAVVLRRGNSLVVQVLDLVSTRLQWEETLPDPDLPEFAWDAPGKTLAILTNRRRGIHFRDRETGQENGPTIRTEEPIHHLTFLPDGSILGLVGSKQVVLWDSATGSVARQINDGPALLGGVCVSQDGRTVAAFGLDQQLRLWDVGTGHLRFRWMLRADPGAVPGLSICQGMTFRSDGQQLALLTGRPMGTLLRIFDTPWSDSTEPEALKPAASLSLRRRLVAQQLGAPWDPQSYSRQVPLLLEEGEADRAALYLAWALWQRHGPRGP
jgi:WD40 repeat protein